MLILIMWLSFKWIAQLNFAYFFSNRGSNIWPWLISFFDVKKNTKIWKAVVTIKQEEYIDWTGEF